MVESGGGISTGVGRDVRGLVCGDVSSQVLGHVGGGVDSLVGFDEGAFFVLEFEVFGTKGCGSSIFSRLGDWSDGISNQVLKSFSGDIMVVEDVVNSVIVDIILSGSVLAGIAGGVLADKGGSVGSGVSAGISSGVLADIGGGVGSRVHLGQCNGDWGWLVDNKVLQVSSGDIFTSEGKHTIFVGLLGKSDSNWRWLINDKVFQVSSGDVLTSESEHAVFVGFLSESNSNWRWLVDDEIFKVASGDIFSTESEHTITI